MVVDFSMSGTTAFTIRYLREAVQIRGRTLNSDILVLLLSIPLFGIFCFYSYKTEGKLGLWEVFS